MSPGPSQANPRTVGPLALLALGINGIVGVGIFFAPTELARLAGRRGSVEVVAAVAAALLPVAATFAILGRRFGEDGGPVTFARTAFGARVAFAVGWLTYVSAIFSNAAVYRGLAEALVGPAHATVTGAALCVALAALAASGIDISKRTWSLLTILKLVPLLLLAALAVAGAPHGIPPEAAPPTPRGIGEAALVACFAFQGFEVVPVLAGHARAPERAVPLAVLGSLGFSALLYAVLQFAFVATASPAGLLAEAPLVETASILGGPHFATLLRAGTSVSALGIAFGMVVTTPRYLAAAVPGSRLGVVGPRGVPVLALLLSTILVLAVFSLSTLSKLFTLASLAVVLQFAIVALALIVLTAKRRLGLRSIHLVPAVFALGVSAALLFVPERSEWVSLAVLAAVGVLVWWKLGPRRPPSIPRSGGA